ncbi:MAG: deoxyribonuclease IV [Nitrospirae bacterium]|nr:deoxyribonuclease IV [Nitrospirota bacterium]
MPLLGAHMSIEGGVSNAPLRGKKVGCDAIQIFTKNNNQWKSKKITDKEITAFKENLDRTVIKAVASHNAYLINLASPRKNVYKKSLNAFYDEMQRAEELGLPYLVFHPGAHLGEGEDIGIKRIAESINLLLSKKPQTNLMLLLETTAGQGTHIGWRFEQLAEIINLVEQKEKMGVCIDTCHIFAAGYDISTEEGYVKTFDEFDRIICLKRLKLFHLNDSKKGLASRVDRHEHIGKGMLGLNTFKMLLNDKRFKDIPMILETPKEKDMKEDKRNLSTLRYLIKRSL